MARRTWEQYEKYFLQRWPLTLREVQIAIQCIKGKKNKEIARDLGISHETVNKHLDHIYKVTGLNSRDKLVAELLIADIDNTPLQQSLTLAGEGASIVGAGFLDTLYASRAERKRPRSVSARKASSRSASDQSPHSNATAATSQKDPPHETAAVIGIDPRVSQRWGVLETGHATGTEDGRGLIGVDSVMKTNVRNA